MIGSDPRESGAPDFPNTGVIYANLRASTGLPRPTPEAQYEFSSARREGRGIHLGDRGAEEFRDGEGSMIRTSLGTLEDARPVSTGDRGRRVPGESSSARPAQTRDGLRLRRGRYAAAAARDDPGLLYDILGGTNSDIGNRLSSRGGQRYVPGDPSTTSHDGGSFRMVETQRDAFVRTDAAGSGLVYSTYRAEAGRRGSGRHQCRGLRLLTGQPTRPTSRPLSGLDTCTRNGDAFVTLLNATGPPSLRPSGRNRRRRGHAGAVDASGAVTEKRIRALPTTMLAFETL